VVQASGTTPVGDVAGWFWQPYCTHECDFSVIGFDAAYAYGWEQGLAGRPVALGAGTNGFFPFVEGYVQLSGDINGRPPYGVGLRVGVPAFAGWAQHEVYGRYDVPLKPGLTLLLNPAILLHHNPFGDNRDSFIGFVQGIGVQYKGRNTSYTPSVTMVRGRAVHGTTDAFDRDGPAVQWFGTASLSVSWHRARKR